MHANIFMIYQNEDNQNTKIEIIRQKINNCSLIFLLLLLYG